MEKNKLTKEIQIILITLFIILSGVIIVGSLLKNDAMAYSEGSPCPSCGGSLKLMYYDEIQHAYTCVECGKCWEYFFHDIDNDSNKCIICEEKATGDANGDGKIDMYDIFSINSHRLEQKKLTGTCLQSADVNSDNSVDIYDIMKVNKYILTGKGL